MEENQQLIRNFYTAFQQRDHAGMNACYHPDIHFSDPAFGELHGKRAMAMWHMLCERGKDLRITFRDVVATQNSGQAKWEATYTFSTGRKVHNVIEARFEFGDGRIAAARSRRRGTLKGGDMVALSWATQRAYRVRLEVSPVGAVTSQELAGCASGSGCEVQIQPGTPLGDVVFTLVAVGEPAQ